MLPRHLKTDAFLLRKVHYGESDQVVVLYTRESGKVSAMARGARKSKKRFGPALEPFILVEAEIDPGRHGGLPLLKSIHPQKALIRLLADLDRLNCGFRLLELVDLFEHDTHAQPELFPLLQASLEALDRGAPILESRVVFEAGLLKLAGLAPQLDGCNDLESTARALERSILSEIGKPLKSASVTARLGI
jgi:DNA repair protein RecO (recombination protein O)